MSRRLGFSWLAVSAVIASLGLATTHGDKGDRNDNAPPAAPAVPGVPATVFIMPPAIVRMVLLPVSATTVRSFEPPPDR